MSRGTCQAPGCGRVLPPGRRRFCSDICRQRGRRAERSYDTAEFTPMVRRLLATITDRAAGGDPQALAGLWQIMREADQAVTDAITGLRAEGFSWAALAAEAGVTRQTLWKWYDRRQRQSAVSHPATASGPALTTARPGSQEAANAYRANREWRRARGGAR